MFLPSRKHRVYITKDNWRNNISEKQKLSVQTKLTPKICSTKVLSFYATLTQAVQVTFVTLCR